MNKHIATLLLCAGTSITDVQAQQIVGYEYWMDEDFASRTTVNDASTDIALEIDVSSLNRGMHYFNFRAKDSEGKYSAVTTQYFYKPAVYTENTLTAYEYWMDDDFESRTTTSNTDGVVNLEIDASSLKRGMHYLNFRAKDSEGKYSAVTTQYFYKPAVYTENTLTAYEYWMDDDFESRTTTSNTDGVVNLEIDASSLKRGMHYLNFRAKDSEGKYSAVTTQYFYKPRATDGGPLVKYAVQFDDMKADTVEIEATTSLTWTDKWLDVPTDDTLRTLDNVTNVARYNHEGIIDPEDIDKIWLKVTAEDERTMKLSFGNEGGGWLTTRDTFTHVSEHTLKAAPIQANYVYRMNEGEGTFAKYIRAKVGTLGLKSDRPCALSIYNETERVTTLTADSVAKGAFINIPEDGVYYFVMQNQADPTRPQSELKLICVNDPLPSPLHVADAGTLADLLTFTDDNSVENLSLTGKIDGNDFRKMEEMENIRTLNLKDVRVVRNTEETDRPTRNDTIHSQAFMAMTNLEELDLPSSTRHVADGAFEGTGDNLLVVNWNSASADIRSESFDADMGNSLIFAPAGTEVSYDGNVVVDGVAEEITLTDRMPFRNPKQFKANHISYTREFTKKTKIGVAGGWEGIVLPFDVQRIISEEKGELQPFGVESGNAGLPCWIAEMQEDATFGLVDKISANRPFIMEVPNSDEYEEVYNIEGTVIFTSDDATVCVTDVQSATSESGFLFTGAYEGVGATPYVYALNEEEYTATNGDIFLPGGVFVSDLRDVHPFEAYVYNAQMTRTRYLTIATRGNATGIPALMLKNASLVDVYTLQGVKIRSQIPAKTLEDKLPAGIYIINGKKVIIR